QSPLPLRSPTPSGLANSSLTRNSSLIMNAIQDKPQAKQEKDNIIMKHSARHTKIDSINYAVSRSFRRRALLLIGCVVAAVALPPLARAVDPPPVGGYPGENTALGEDALFSYDTSIQGENTACGHDSLHNLSTGIYNTAFGDDTLHDSTGGNNNT